MKIFPHPVGLMVDDRMRFVTASEGPCSFRCSWMRKNRTSDRNAKPRSLGR